MRSRGTWSWYFRACWASSASIDSAPHRSIDPLAGLVRKGAEQLPETFLEKPLQQFFFEDGEQFAQLYVELNAHMYYGAAESVTKDREREGGEERILNLLSCCPRRAARDKCSLALRAKLCDVGSRVNAGSARDCVARKLWDSCSPHAPESCPGEPVEL